jgi:hypothetical protein
MSQKNTPALGQFPRNSSVNVTTATGGSLTAPTNTGLVFTAGPDGTDIEQIAAIATAVQTSAQTIELFTSLDFGASFTALPMTGSFAASAAVAAVCNIAMPNTLPMGPSNCLRLPGCAGVFTHRMDQSLLSELSNYYVGKVPSGGTANAQTLAMAYNSAGTQLAAAPTTGDILDMVAGLSCSAAMTIQAGAAGAGVTVKRSDAADTATNDVVKYGRYRFVFNGTNWILLATARLYAAITQTQAVTVSAWGVDR